MTKASAASNQIKEISRGWLIIAHRYLRIFANLEICEHNIKQRFWNSIADADLSFFFDEDEIENITDVCVACNVFNGKEENYWLIIAIKQNKETKKHYIPLGGLA